ncbi:hypothetical protein SBADM41S_03263 [Streptomyces badius]
MAQHVVGQEVAEPFGHVRMDLRRRPQGLEEVDEGARAAGVGAGRVELGHPVAASAGARVDGQRMGEVHLIGVETLHGRVEQFLRVVPDGDPAQVGLLEEVGDPGGRSEVEQGVGGRPVAQAGAEVEQVVDGDPGGVPEAAEAGRPRRGDPPGRHVQQGRTVQLTAPDAFERGERERNLDQGGRRQVRVRIDAQLLPRVQVPHQQARAQAAFGQPGAHVPQQGLGVHAAFPPPAPAGSSAPRQRVMASPSRASMGRGLPSATTVRA